MSGGSPMEIRQGFELGWASKRGSRCRRTRENRAVTEMRTSQRDRFFIGLDETGIGEPEGGSEIDSISRLFVFLPQTPSASLRKVESTDRLRLKR